MIRIPNVARIAEWCEQRSEKVVIALGALLFLPRLGSVGLFDPWETHYAEVAREMIARGDFVHPHWSNAYFFSKPVLSLWLMALGMEATRAEPGVAGAPLGAFAEWGVRLPFALLAILALWAVHRIGKHLVDARTGLLAAFVLATSPQFVLIGKQAVTDMPLVALTWLGLAFLLPAAFPAEGDQPARWRDAALSGACFGLAALAKGLEVLVLVAPVFLGTILLTRDWGAIKRSRPFVLVGAFLLVAAPWYLAMSTFGGRDDEGMTFVSRFWVHDHFARLADGVHGDRGGAGYYAEQILYGFFPWSALLPVAAAALIAEIQKRKSAGALIFVLLSGAWLYAFFTVSQTKFHHYIFPALPAFALVVGAWARRFAQNPKSVVLPGAVVLVAALYCVALRDLVVDPRSLVNLFTYKYDREFPSDVIVRPFLIAIAGGGGALALVAILRRWQRLAIGAYAGTALVLALWISHYHFNMLSAHWSQAHLFATYYAERRPGDSLLAYQLNWRGENFYSRDEAVELLNAGAGDNLRQRLAGPGRKFIVVESNRIGELRAALPAEARGRLEILDKSNSHYYLCAVNEG